MKKRTALDFGVPLLLLLVLTVVIRSNGLDLRVSAPYYLGDRAWKYEEPEPWKFLYDHGTLFAIVPAVIALGVFVAGLFRKDAARHRRAAAFLVLSLSLGPGLVVNSIFKEHYGRPRPRDVLRFDGDQRFREVWALPKGGGHSFPSGHAATAFWLVSPWFLLRRKRPRVAAAFLPLGFAYGALMGLARIGQGAHYLSDVVWACGFTWLVSALLSRALGLERREE
ncbi:MAG: phosphatase PAP2 family protein [Candidatus Eisenbacteria bacterium]